MDIFCKIKSNSQYTSFFLLSCSVISIYAKIIFRVKLQELCYHIKLAAVIFGPKQFIALSGHFLRICHGFNLFLGMSPR